MMMDVTQIQELVENIRGQFSRVIVGKEEVLDWMIVGILVGGHVLMEGVPGTSKTLMVRTLARLMDADFNRIQFTPDLMPSDILGTNIFQIEQGQFQLAKGPIFTDFLLADEINRTPAKTQSALLEAMEERQVTIDGVNYPMSDSFMVFATMNPLEYEGTYPLPEAQLDRFLLKILVDYPSASEEDEILRRYHQGFDARKLHSITLQTVATRQAIHLARSTIQHIKIEDSLLQYIRQVVGRTRESNDILLGGGPRASIYILLCAKALAAMRGRDFVIPDDIKAIAFPILRHRLILEPDLQMEGITVEEVISNLLETVSVPR